MFKNNKKKNTRTTSSTSFPKGTLLTRLGALCIIELKKTSYPRLITSSKFVLSNTNVP